MKSVWSRIAGAWNRFFFEPISPVTIAVYRIFFGLVVFIAILGIFPFRNIFYSVHGLVDPSVMAPYSVRNPLFLFHWVPGTDPGLMLYLMALMVLALMLSAGFLTRLASIGVFIGLLSLYNRNAFITNAGDELMRINALWLIFAEAGAALSVDRWLRIRRGTEQPGPPPLKSPLGQRLLQIQLAYLYFDTCLQKLHGESWLDGTAMYYALNYLELKRFSFKYLFYYLWQIKLATWGTLVAEGSMATLVWSRKFRYPCLFAAFCLHFGINLAMQFPVFQYVMMASLINFVYPEDMQRALDYLARSLPRPSRRASTAQGGA